MSSPAKLLVWTIPVLLALFGGTVARAQRMAQPKPQPIEASGTVAAVGPMAVKLTTATNQTWIFRLSRNTKVAVTGTADADYLHPGLFVEFTTDLDRRGSAPNKVTELVIFTPTMQKFPGLFPAGGGGFGDAPAAKKDPNATTSYKVMGQITSMKNDKITVNAARGVVKFELNDSPKISVDIADYTAARQGDKIEVKGTSAQEGYGDASDVTIEMAKPLAGAKSKTAKKPDEKEEPGDKPEKPERKTRPKRERRPKGEPKEESKEEPKEEPKEKEKTEEKAAARPVSEAAGGRAEQIVQRLQLKPGDAPGRKPTKIAVGPETAEVFAPSRPEPLKDIEGLLGKSETGRTVEGMMSLAEGQEPQFVSLQLVVGGGVKLFVDREGIVQFYQVQKP
jgi:hypothetical protein